MSLALVYGSVTFVSSYTGSALVHKLQDSYGQRRSFITAIVAVGVGISAGLTIFKFVKMVSGGIVESGE